MDFKPKEPKASVLPSNSSQKLEDANARYFIRHLDRVAVDKTLPEAAALRVAVHHLAVQDELLTQETSNPTCTLPAKKQRNKNSKHRDPILMSDTEGSQKGHDEEMPHANGEGEETHGRVAAMDARQEQGRKDKEARNAQKASHSPAAFQPLLPKNKDEGLFYSNSA
ncbi:hypothetical protein EJ07DRAFT_183678 [Lizonia empirigonia]|nr:hypothetical protein EJ07DRAFT_183678 [Lizonia empirigonia]